MKTRIQTRLLILLAAVIAFASCSKQADSLDRINSTINSKPNTTDPLPYGAVDGTIVPYLKGTTVYVANALYQSHPVETDENGNFRIENLDSGIYSLYITFEVSGVTETTIVENIHVKPLMTNHIGVIYLQ